MLVLKKVVDRILKPSEESTLKILFLKLFIDLNKKELNNLLLNFNNKKELLTQSAKAKMFLLNFSESINLEDYEESTNFNLWYKGLFAIDQFDYENLLE